MSELKLPVSTPSPKSTEAPAPDKSAGTRPSTEVDAFGVGQRASHANGAGLCDLLSPQKFNEVRRLFADLTGLEMQIFDHQGRPLSEARASEESDHACDCSTGDVLAPLTPQVDEQGRPCYTAPIVVDDQRLGTIRIRSMDSNGRDPHPVALPEPLRMAAAALLQRWATGIAQACHQEHQLRQRVEELTLLFRLSTLLSERRSLQEVLETAARSTAELLSAKAASIGLLDENELELIPKAVHNLSDAYLNKGPILLERSELYRAAVAGKIVYVRDMTTDPRVLYPDEARREGLRSMLAMGMTYRGKIIGVVRLYAGEIRIFTPFEVNLLQAITQLVASAIANARLHGEAMEAQVVQRQLRLAADVQRRMLPSTMPHMPPLDIAAQYVPSFELGGDFYDFIYLDGHLGIALGDVVGKGIAASLLMSSVRASLRAYAQDVYDLDEIIGRVNIALSRDTLDNEFATLFYGVLDPATRRLTYCNAGHEPPLLLRNGQVSYLTAGGMIVGVDAGQLYEKGLIDLYPGDMLLIYSDGLSEAMNFNGQKFGRQRIIDAMKQAVHLPAAAALKHILWQMRCFTGLQRTLDDTTTVLVKVDK